MIHRSQIQNQITFMGLKDVEVLADKQVGPTCGFEAIENIIQLFHRVGNDLSQTDLLPRARTVGAAVRCPTGEALDIHAYNWLLGQYGIPATWYAFNHNNVLLPAVSLNRGVILIVHAPYLDPLTYPDPSNVSHAIVLTHYYVNEFTGLIEGYVGMDSNVEHKVVAWPHEFVEQAVLWVLQHITPEPVLVTDIPVTWPSPTSYYIHNAANQVVPVD